MGFVRVRFRTIVLVACFVAVVQVYLQSWIYRVALTPELDGKQQHEEIITVTGKAKNVISLREQKKAKYTNRPHDLPPKRVIFHIPNKWQDLSPRCTLNDTIEISHERDSLTHTIICLVPTDESSGIVRLELYNHEKNDIRKTYLHHISSDEIDIAEQEICSLFPAARQADVKKHYFLASFPRSGNTWSRRLLEGATGICTGSVFNDKYLLKMGFSCEGKRKNVLVIKTHLPITPKHHRMVLVNVTGAVIIVRNIFDSIYSYFNYEKSLFLHNVTLDEKLFQGKEWAEYVEKSRNRWLLFYEYWEKYQNPKIYIRYEDLHAHPKLELSRMLGFLERSVDFQRISCTLNGTAVSQTGRTGSSKMGLARRYFTIDMQKKILNKAGPMMRRYGYGSFVDLIAEEISSAEN